MSEMGRVVKDVKKVVIPPCGFFVALEKGDLPIKVEKRAKGKKVTIISNIRGSARSALITLQSLIGVGGNVVTPTQIELQGAIEARVINELKKLNACERLETESAAPAPFVLASTGYSSFLRKTQDLINKRRVEESPILPTAFILPESCIKLHGDFWPYCVGTCQDVDLSDVFDNMTSFQRNPSSPSTETLITSVPKDAAAVARAIDSLSARVGTAIKEAPVMFIKEERRAPPPKPAPQRRRRVLERQILPLSHPGLPPSAWKKEVQSDDEGEAVPILTAEELETLRVLRLDTSDEFWARLFARVEAGMDLHDAFSEALTDALDAILVIDDEVSDASSEGEYHVPHLLWVKLTPQQHRQLEELGISESKTFWDAFGLLVIADDSDAFNNAIRREPAFLNSIRCPVCMRPGFASESDLDRHIDDCLSSSLLSCSFLGSFFFSCNGLV